MLRSNPAIQREEYARYSRLLYPTCLRILANAQEAEEAMHDALLHYFSFSGSFDSEAQKRSWLFKVATSKSIDRLRKKYADFFEHVVVETEDDLQTQDDRLDTSDTEAQVSRIKEAMGMLAPGYRTVLSLVLFEGYDFDEISNLLSLRSATVRSQYVRGRNRLRTLLLTQAIQKQMIHD